MNEYKDTELLNEKTACINIVENEENANEFTGLKKDNRGIGVVEIVLILVVIIALIIIFKDKIMEIINNAFESITSGASSL